MKGCKNNRKQRNLTALFACILKSVFASSDSLDHITYVMWSSKISQNLQNAVFEIEPNEADSFLFVQSFNLLVSSEPIANLYGVLITKLSVSNAVIEKQCKKKNKQTKTKTKLNSYFMTSDSFCLIASHVVNFKAILLAIIAQFLSISMLYILYFFWKFIFILTCDKCIELYLPKQSDNSLELSEDIKML